MVEFPAHPVHGMLFELRSGLVYQYDIGLRTWNKVMSDTIQLHLATVSQPGAMSAEDFRKLNRLVIPPPQSSLRGTDCPGPFRHGYIGLFSGDDYISIDGNIPVKNVGFDGELLHKEFPFHIHQHTFGFDFRIDVPALAAELQRRGQIDVSPRVGPKGEQGDKGDPGDDEILTGPVGDKGPDGTAPACTTVVDREIISAEPRPGLRRGLTGATIKIDPDDDSKFSVVVERQVLGSPDASTSQFVVKQQQSPWLLAVASPSSGPQEIYYLDIDPILDTIHKKFLEEVARLKLGYENVVQFWVQTMSDLFDEQKAALCCALEFCISKTKSTQVRQHMESVAAAAVGNARIKLHARNDAEAVEISSTTLFPSICQEDLCFNGETFPKAIPVASAAPAIFSQVLRTPHMLMRAAFPNTGQIILSGGACPQDAKWVGSHGQYVTRAVGGWILNSDDSKWLSVDCDGTAAAFIDYTWELPIDLPELAEAQTLVVWGRVASDDAITQIQLNGRDVRFDPQHALCAAGINCYDAWEEFQLPGAASFRTGRNVVRFVVRNRSFKTGFRCEWLRFGGVPALQTSEVVVDARLHAGNSYAGVALPLDAGEYIATIKEFSVQRGGQYHLDAVIQHTRHDKPYIARFLDKGRFTSVIDAKSAYEGLTLAFQHTGGIVRLYYPTMAGDAIGTTTIILQKIADISDQVSDPYTCSMSTGHLAWYAKGWQHGRCCGVVMRIAGQEYIICKRSLGSDMGCGGGESQTTPCIAQFLETHGHPAFAWPTLDGQNYGPIPAGDNIKFMYDQHLNALVLEKLASADYTMPKGRPGGARHLQYQITTVLFPVQ